MSGNPFLAAFANEPVLIAQEKQDLVTASINALIQRPDFAKMVAEPDLSGVDNFWPAADDWRARYRPYAVQDGILHIPVRGVLLHNFGFADGAWATGYQYIERAFLRGIEDAGVKAIAFIIDSPGGAVAGCFDAVDRMYAAKNKPVRAFAHENMYSAAYAVGAGVADRIIVSRTGGVGSVGVLTSHVDMSKMLSDIGVKYTFIFSGKHKVDGNSTEPLPDAVRDRIQARLDELREVFVTSVARNRSRLSVDDLLNSEARTFTASQAVENGFADAFGALDDALAAFAADLSASIGDDNMSTQDKAAVDTAALEAAKAEGKREAETAAVAATETAVKAERARVTGILGCDEAKGREALAAHFAEEGMSLESSKKALALAPKAAAEKPAEDTAFDAAMKKDNPDLGAAGGKKLDEDAEADKSAELLALAASNGLPGFRSAAK